MKHTGIRKPANQAENCRKGGRYIKTPLSLKLTLLKLVFQEGQPIKKVAQALKIKYSTAKTLARQYKLGKQLLEWEDYQNQRLIREVKTLDLKRCSYVEIEQPDSKNDQKESQTDEANLNCSPQRKSQIQVNHIHNLPSSHKIEVISRTINSGICTKTSHNLG